MKPTFAMLVLVLLSGSPTLATAAQTFELAGVTVSLAEDGWEIFDAKATSGNIGTGGIDGTIAVEAKLLLRRADDGKVLAALLVRGSRGTSKPIRFRNTNCPTGPADRFYARSLASRSADPPQCLVIGGPFDGRRVLEQSFPDLRAAQAEHPFEAPSPAWLVLSFANNSLAAQFSVEGLVASEPFGGLPGREAVAAVPASMSPAVAAWGDALGAATSKALDGMFSRATSLPAITLTAADAPR